MASQFAQLGTASPVETIRSSGTEILQPHLCHIWRHCFAGTVARRWFSVAGCAGPVGPERRCRAGRDIVQEEQPQFQADRACTLANSYTKPLSVGKFTENEAAVGAAKSK